MLLVPTQPGLKASAARCAACEYGPLATRRKRLAFACRCTERTLGSWADRRVRKLLEAGRAFADRSAPIGPVLAALREVEVLAADAKRRAGADVWSLFEGFRAGDALADARTAQTTARVVNWALGTGGATPTVPPGWDWARTALAAASDPPTCPDAWRTSDVLALARLALAGESDVLPILADALEDAGCTDERVLGHCRDAGVGHTAGCWVPDLILDADDTSCGRD